VGSKTVPFTPVVDQSSPNLVGMYGSDRSMQRRFPVTAFCSNLEISAIKSHNGVVENYVFPPTNFWGEGPQNQMRTFYAPIETHQAGNFGAVPPQQIPTT